MAKVQLSDSFQVCPEGIHTFKIIEAKYDTQFQVITLKLKTGDGYIDREQYSLVNSDGEINEAALGSFSYMARCAFGDPDLQDIDPEKLVGFFVKAKVTHTQSESKKIPGKILTFSNLSEIEPGDPNDWNAALQAKNERITARTTGQSVAPTPTINQAQRSAAGFDLDALFGKKGK